MGDKQKEFAPTLHLPCEMHLGVKEEFFLHDSKSKVEIKAPLMQGAFSFSTIRKTVSQCHIPTQGASQYLKIIKRDWELCTASTWA